MIKSIAPYLLRYTRADDPRVLKELFWGQYKQFTVNTYAILFFLLALAVIFRESLQTIPTLLWGAVHMVTGPYYIYLFKRFYKIPEHKRDYKKWYIIALRMECTSGFMWGIMPWVFFFIDHQLTLPIITLGAIMVITVCMALMFLPGGFAVYGTPAIFLQSTCIIILRPDLFMMGLLGYMFMVIAVISTLNVNKAFASASLLRFKNQDMLETVEQANVAKSTFLAAASHDLRQPLHALNLLISALSTRKKYDQKTVDSMQKSVNSLEMLFTSLLDVSKLDAGVIEAKVKAVNLLPVFSDIQHDFAGLAEEKNIDFNIPSENIAINTDALLLKRIISNLVSNAIRYTPKNGTVDLNFEAASNATVHINITDTGCGIPPEEAENIFTEFTQLNNPERDREKGLGLGLAIVKRLCDLLGYRIDLYPRQSGGTQFSISLPDSLSTLPAVTTEQQNNTLPPASVNPRPQGVVLVIDDERDVLDAMYELLSCWGYSTLLADSEAAALDILSEGGFMPDLILSDYRLRENKTGVEAIEAVCRLAQQPLPAILITGDTHPEKIFSADTSQYLLLHKPVKPELLKQHIQDLLHRQ